MVGVAQLVEPRIVIPVVVGSSPIVHPISYKALKCKAFQGFFFGVVVQWCDPRISMHHLRRQKRSGIYYYRQAIPKPLRKLSGASEVVFSLHTRDRRIASLLAYQVSAMLLVEFESAKQMADKFDIDKLVQSVKQGHTRHWTVDLEGIGKISTNPNASDPVKEHQQAMEALSLLSQKNRAQQEEIHQVIGSTRKNLYSAFNEYKSELEAQQKKSRQHIIPAIKKFVDWINEQHQNIAVNEVKQTHIKEYKQFLRGFQNKKTGQKGLSPSTVYNRLGFIETFFRYCQDQKYYPDGERNLPTHKQKGAKPDAVAVNRDYQAFSTAEIKEIFAVENYQSNTLPHQFWLPLLGLYTGARLAELCYVNPYSVNNDNPEQVWVLEFSQATKNHSSKRTIPIHQSLIDLGFLEYVEALKQCFEKPETLFPYSTNPDKAGGSRFHHYIRNTLEISNPRKVFHSFRSNVAEKLKMAGVPENYSQYYIGHLSKNIHSYIYAGQNKPIGLFKSYIEQLDYPVEINSLKELSDPVLTVLGRKARQHNRQKRG